MAEYPLTATVLPSTTCYPNTVQGLVNSAAEYLNVRIDEILQPYTVDDTAPDSTATQNPWFQTTTVGSGYGLPKVVRLYVNGQWKEFSQFRQGDMILVSLNYPITRPWGESGVTYTFGDTGLGSYTAPTLPNAPEGFKYKVYVGYYS